ncbi:MAG: tetratricopeptide repeat protein [Bacteroidales bacterium]|jgi:tetratricopeptide (TPR) repeat protein|nr:tetratricopeptide repeat protein [Bacteroidales bacterium]
MNRKLILLISISQLLSFSLFSQKTIVVQEPQRTLLDAQSYYNDGQYAAAYQQYSAYISLKKAHQDLDLSDAFFYKALCADKLENNDAEGLIKEFLFLFPHSVRKLEAVFTLANLYQKKGEFQKAIQTYNTIDINKLTIDQQNEFNYKLAYCYFQDNAFEEAKTLFEEVKTTKNKYYSPSTYYYAHILYTEKNYDYALKEFKLLKNDKNFKGIVPYYIAQIYYLEGNYKELVKQSRELSQYSNSKRSSQVNRMLGEAYCNLQRYDEAIEYLEKSVKDNEAASLEDNYLFGYCLSKTNNYDRAIPYLLKASSNNDSLSQNALYNLAYCYLKTGDKHSSRSSFYEAYNLDFDAQIKEDALLNYAKLSYELPNPFNETLKSFQLYYDSYPQSKNINEVKEYLAQLYGASKNYANAIKLIEELPNRSSAINEAYQRVTLNRGIELFNEGNYKEAIQLFNKSLKNPINNTLSAGAYFLRGESLYRLGNYEGAIRELNSFFKTKDANKSVYYSKANYSLAYNYFKQKKYDKAIEYFNKFLSQSSGEHPQVISDAHNRIADCYFMEKKFSFAEKEYDIVIKTNLIDVDYALYQKALCCGLLSRINEKARLLLEGLKDFENSPYRASMLFELANSYLVLEQNDKALQTYKQVVEKYPQSIHAKSAISKIGMLYYKEGKDDLALRTLDKLVRTYPATEESQSGLKSIRTIYANQNKVSEYYNYVKTVPNADFTVNEEDSVSYEVAENFYMNNQLSQAKVSLEEYLEKFPLGFFSINAHYYLADCFMKEEKKDSALYSYLFVCSSAKNPFTEKSLLNAANISYEMENFTQANKLYRLLENQTDINAHKSSSLIGIMRSEFNLKNFDSCILFSQKVLSLSKNSQALIDEANYLMAKSYYEKGDIENAIIGFEKLKQSKNGEYSGEASYVFAKKTFDENRLDEAEKLILSYSSNPTSEYFLAKDLILLGDIYVAKNKNMIAKQTFQSIVDNYDNAQIVDIAKKKIEEIEEKENREKEELQIKAEEKKNEVDEVILQ